MKHVIAFLACLFCLQLFACNRNNEITSSSNDIWNTDTMKLKITIGTNTFTATVYNNATATAFKVKLPLTINMAELNGNEKYFDLPDNLPTNASNPGTIQTGDIMLYGSNNLVLFYRTFSTSYNYSRIARLDNVSGLADALGSGNKTVKFELHAADAKELVIIPNAGHVDLYDKTDVIPFDKLTSFFIRNLK